jgi:hypothetical protein
MRKILVMGVMALGLALASEQTASAWVNFKFGAGVNWNWQSGGNNFLWGLFRNGQPPAPDCPPGYGYGPGVGHGYPGPGPYGPSFPGPIPPYGPQDFQYFGNRTPSQPPVPQGTQGQTQPMPVAQAYRPYTQPLVRPVSYNPYGSSPAASYYYTAQPQYGSYNMPLYWGY